MEEIWDFAGSSVVYESGQSGGVIVVCEILHFPPHPPPHLFPPHPILHLHPISHLISTQSPIHPTSSQPPPLLQPHHIPTPCHPQLHPISHPHPILTVLTPYPLHSHPIPTPTQQFLYVAHTAAVCSNHPGSILLPSFFVGCVQFWCVEKNINSEWRLWALKGRTKRLLII